MWFGHSSADGLHEREDNQRSNGVTDERRNDQNQGCEDDQNAIQTHALDLLSDSPGDGMQQAGGRNGFTEGKTTSGEDDDCPEEVIEVLLCEDAGAEEENHGDDGYNAHVSEDAFELMSDAPEEDGGEGDGADEPLHAGEFVFHWTDGDDGGAFARLEGDEKEDPD